MEVLSNNEVEAVIGGSYVKSYEGVSGGFKNPGPNPEDRAAYEKYIKAYNTWQAKHPNLDQEFFDSIYFRY